MMDMSVLESRCTKIAIILKVEGHNEIAMLRTARRLKGIHTHLEQSLRDYTRTEGRSALTVRVERCLEAMERDIRHVLLNYLSLDEHEVHERLAHALDHSRQTLSLLDSPPSPGPSPSRWEGSYSRKQVL